MRSPANALATTALLLCPLLAAGQEAEPLAPKSPYWEALAADLPRIASHLNTDEATLKAMPAAGQVVPHKDGGAVLLVGTADAPAVVLIGVSADKKAVWRHFDPTGGKHLQLEELSVRIRGDRDGNTLLVWAEPAVRARLYDRLGKARWTATLAEGEEVASFDVAPWPGQGWLVTFATVGEGGRLGVQRIDGRKRWGDRGKSLGPNGSPFGANPVFAVRDSADSFFLLWHDFATLTYQAQRVDASGKALWKAPVVAGKGSEDFLRREAFRRIRPAVGRDGQVRVTLYCGVANDVTEALEPYPVTISPAGVVTRDDGRGPKR